MEKVRIGIVGVGAISGIYLQNITGMFHEIEVAGICDLVREKAENAAAQYPGIKIYETMYDVFADPEVDIVLNLTRPYEHYGVTSEALKAGKHVYSEKPLAATLEEGRALVELARGKGLMLGGAPDTFMGAGIQTCRRLIDDGYIGRPIGAAANMICHGHESWHPDPAFYYQHGGGPMMDMGPYYITALVNLLGGVSEVSGMVQTSFPQRTITSQPLNGTMVDVEVPTHVTGMMRFAAGAVGTIITTFDVYHTEGVRLEVYGTEGTLFVPDPNTFGGPVRMLRREDPGHVYELPLMYPYADNSRALGLADMAKALRTGKAFRADCRQTLHVLEIMESFRHSSEQGRCLKLASTYERGAAMDPALPGGHL